MSARTRLLTAYSLVTASLFSGSVAGVFAQADMPKAAPNTVPVHLMPAPASAPAASISGEPKAPANPVTSQVSDVPAPDAAAALTINTARPPQTAVAPQTTANAAPVAQSNGLATQFPTNEVASALERISLQGWQPISVPSSELDPDRIAMLKEYGCKNSYTRVFQRGQRRIIANVYAFASSQGAYGAYSLLRRGSSTVIPKGDASSEDDQSVSIWKDRYFITVSGTSEDDEESKGAVTTVANQLNAASSARGQLPQLIARLPNLDRVRGTEKVVMGPVSARKFFPAPSLISLSFANSLGAGLADYALQAPFRERMKLMIVDYTSAAAAQAAYDKYVTAIEDTHPNMAPDDSAPRAIFKMANSYLMCELRSQRILLISGARKRTTPMVLSRQVI